MPVKKKPGRPAVKRVEAKLLPVKEELTIISEIPIDAIPTAAVSTVAPSTESKPVVKWFSEVDLNSKGKPASDFPARYFDVHIQELQEEVDGLQKQLDLDIHRGKDLLRIRKELATKKGRLDSINESKATFTPIVKDKIHKVAGELGERISESMFTRDANDKRLVDAHEEARRMSTPCIAVKSEIEADYYKQAGVPIIDGKVSRNHAEIAYKIMMKSVGEGSVNTEMLRR